MTESEAKTKRCVGPVPSNTGRLVREGGEVWYACSGFACMGWRNEMTVHVDKNGLFYPENPPDGATLQKIGYCGKAGKP